MATYRLMQNKKWKVEIAVKGFRQVKTFPTKNEAQIWAAEREEALRGGRGCSRLTFGEMLGQYAKEVVEPYHKGARHDILRIGKFRRDPIAKIKLADLRHRDLQRLADRMARLPSECTGRPLSPASIERDFNILSAALNWAVCVKEYIVQSPCKMIRKPKGPEHRERIPTEEEIEKITRLGGYEEGKAPRTTMALTAAAFLFACRTGMRSGEILRMERDWIGDRVIHIPAEATKTNCARDVALSKEAQRILDDVLAAENSPTVWGLSDAVRATVFTRIKGELDLNDVRDGQGRLVRVGLHFHDSRAYFCTWAAMPGPSGAPRLDILTLARQLGHHQIKMLQRYYRPTAQMVAGMLDA